MESMLWYFFLYSFLGWCTEVVFAAFKNRRFVNRGFLNGPLCPLYGCGLLAVLLILQPYRQNLLILYLGSVLLTTGIELATGFFMEKLFHQRWWNYSKMPFNIGGYVCPLFSMIWGLACMLIVLVIHPRVAGWVAQIPEPIGIVLLCVFCITFTLDVCVTVATVARLNRRLTQIDEVSAALRLVSDKLGSTVADGAIALQAADERAGEELLAVKERARDSILNADELARTELKTRYGELKTRYGELIDCVNREQKRILKAFPEIRSNRHPDALIAAQEKLARLRVKKNKKSGL